MKLIDMQGVKKDYPLGNTTVHALKTSIFGQSRRFSLNCRAIRQRQDHDAEHHRLH